MSFGEAGADVGESGVGGLGTTFMDGGFGKLQFAVEIPPGHAGKGWRRGDIEGNGKGQSPPEDDLLVEKGDGASGRQTKLPEDALGFAFEFRIDSGRQHGGWGHGKTFRLCCQCIYKHQTGQGKISCTGERLKGRLECGRKVNIENHENRFADMERRKGRGCAVGARASRPRCSWKAEKSEKPNVFCNLASSGAASCRTMTDGGRKNGSCKLRKPPSPRPFADAILRLLRDPALRATLASSAKSLATARHTLPAYRTTLARLYPPALRAE